MKSHPAIAALMAAEILPPEAGNEARGRAIIASIGPDVAKEALQVFAIAAKSVAATRAAAEILRGVVGETAEANAEPQRCWDDPSSSDQASEARTQWAIEAEKAAAIRISRAIFGGAEFDAVWRRLHYLDRAGLR